MKVLVASVRIAIALTLALVVVDAAKAQQPVELGADAGVVTMVATVEAVDEMRQLVTVVGPHNNWVVVKVGPEHIELG